MHRVWRQDWEESERGWGTRPDGYSLHVTKAARDAYVKGYYREFNNADEAPDEYTRIAGSPYEVECDDETWALLISQRNNDWRQFGIRGYE